MISNENNLAIGRGAAANAYDIRNCIIIGPDVPEPPPGSDGVVRIGKGRRYIEMRDPPRFVTATLRRNAFLIAKVLGAL